MSYLERIQKHNTDLQAVISKANALPEAGGAEMPSQEKYEVISTNGIFEIKPDEGYTLSKVTADVIVPIPDGYIKPSGTLNIDENGTYDVTDKASVEVNIPTGGDGAEIARSIADRTITAYTDSEITSVGTYAFCGCNKMASVNVPKATTFGNYAFSSCTLLASVNFPLLTSIGQYSFNACTSLANIQGASVTSVGNYAFTGCTALASVDFPNMKTIGQYAFQNCSLLETIDGENVTSVGNYGFTGCSNLTNINLPLVTSVGQYAFNGCAASHISLPSLKSMSSGAFRGSKFVSVDLPIVTNIANNGFRAQGYIKSITLPKVTSTASEAMRNCTALTYVDLPLCASFGTYTFYDCSNLETLILRKTDKICTMGNANVLTNTKIASGTGYVYVPSALKASYENGTNWTKFSTQFRALEDYTVDGTTTGALDFEKAGIVI